MAPCFRILSMAALPTSHAVVADVTMAPSSNPTDDPATMNYWIVDRHLDNGNHPDENDGLLYEMSLDASPPPPPPQRTLAVQTQGAGTGTVTGPGISCPGDCTETYADGQQVSPDRQHRAAARASAAGAAPAPEAVPAS